MRSRTENAPLPVTQEQIDARVAELLAAARREQPPEEARQRIRARLVAAMAPRTTRAKRPLLQLAAATLAGLATAGLAIAGTLSAIAYLSPPSPPQHGSAATGVPQTVSQHAAAGKNGAGEQAEGLARAVAATPKPRHSGVAGAPQTGGHDPTAAFTAGETAPSIGDAGEGSTPTPRSPLAPAAPSEIAESPERLALELAELEGAYRSFADARYEQARSRLELYLSRFPQGLVREEALVLGVRLACRAEGPEAAQGAYERLHDAFPTSAYLPVLTAECDPGQRPE